MKNIADKIKKKEAGENFFKLLKHLPFNESYKNVNLIIYKFIKLNDLPLGYKKYIAKIYKNIRNWC